MRNKNLTKIADTRFKGNFLPNFEFQNFFSLDSTPIHPLQILKKVPVQIAYNFINKT